MLRRFIIEYYKGDVVIKSEEKLDVDLLLYPILIAYIKKLVKLEKIRIVYGRVNGDGPF